LKPLKKCAGRSKGKKQSSEAVENTSAFGSSLPQETAINSHSIVAYSSIAHMRHLEKMNLCLLLVIIEKSKSVRSDIAVGTLTRSISPTYYDTAVIHRLVSDNAKPMFLAFMIKPYSVLLTGGKIRKTISYCCAAYKYLVQKHFERYFLLDTRK
jgi:hypothetical protein